MAHSLKVFCDFDGTVALNDVGNEFFTAFGSDAIPRIVDDLLEGRITPRECYEKEFAALRPVRQQDVEEFVRRQDLDPSFKEFAASCALNGIDCRIVSDGFDFYIARILEQNGLEHVPFFANRLVWTIDPATDVIRFTPEYPYTDSECDRCAHCKRNQMLTLSGDDDIIVYIGDGVSDRCPVRYADVVFAKGELVAYCQDRNITYHRFSTFHGISEKLGEMAGRKRLKKRREAEMHRRDVFMQG